VEVDRKGEKEGGGVGGDGKGQGERTAHLFTEDDRKW